MEEDGSKVQPPTKITIKDGRKPAEIYRTDLITAMKIPDHQIIPPNSYFGLTDAWKQEWERGVQVPVNTSSLPQPSFQLAESGLHPSCDFKMPNKLAKAETATKGNAKHVAYDLDDEDVEWLKTLNRSRKNRGLELVDEVLLEEAITCMEDQCYTNMGETISTEKGLSIEYDEDVSCDVCRVPECEDGNEILFCDVCDVAVHQACYGVQKVPVGSWVCRPCAQMLSDSPCLLCPVRGGAMKRTKSKGYQGWIHVSCALWVPEVGIGDALKMEPITRIETITPGRWNLLCYICKERKGACIQCSVKTCVTAFHVTCGFNNNLDMQTLLDDSAPDGVKHVCYCYKHGSKKGHKSPRKSPRKSGAANTPVKTPQSPRCSSPMSATKKAVEQENIRQRKLRGMEEEFYNFVDTKDLATELNTSNELAKTFYHFWTLKRKSRDDSALLPPTAEQQECLAGRQVKPYQRATMEIERVLRLRQDLERIRNLCYMVEKREKQKRDLTRARETVFWKELEVVGDVSGKMTSEDVEWARSCCANNFTEYETLQNLDFNYNKNVIVVKRKRGRPRKEHSSGGQSSSTAPEVRNQPNHCLEKERLRVGENSECERPMINPGGASDTTMSASEPHEYRESSTANSEAKSSNDVVDRRSIGASHTKCSDGAMENAKRLRDMSSDSDFEEESFRKTRRRSSVRRRLVKSARKSGQRNGFIQHNETAPTSPDQNTERLNGLHAELSKDDRLLRLEKNKTNINNSNTSSRTFPGRKRNGKTAGKMFLKMNSSCPETLPCRPLRSNGAFLDGKMVLDKCDIPISPNGSGLINGVPCSPDNQGSTVQNGTWRSDGELEYSREKRPVDAEPQNCEKQQNDQPKSDRASNKQKNPSTSDSDYHQPHSEVSYRTRSRSSSSGEPLSPPLPQIRTASVFPRSYSADHATTLRSRRSLEECLGNNKLRITRQSPGKSRRSVESSTFSNSTRCGQFFGEFRQTATTSA